MSSGERAKPPATYEERNPFDISRRSQKEVASEIAQRMAALKQARGRSYAAPSTAPAAPSSTDAASREGQPSPPPAPVQPARAPKFAERPAQAPQPTQAPGAEASPPQRAAAAAPAGREARAPLFAAVSVQRAMPPPPSPKQPSARARSSADEARTEAGDRDERAVAAPQDDVQDDVARRDELPAAAEPTMDAPPSPLAAAITETAAPRPTGGGSPHADPVSTAAPPGSPVSGETSPAGNADETETRRAKARDIRARWMAAHDFEGVPATVEEPRAATPDAREVASPDVEQPHIASAVPPTAALDDRSGRQEPVFDAPVETQRPADRTVAAPSRTEMPDEAPPVETPGIAAIPPVEALDALAGRKEPTFDASKAPVVAPASATRQDHVSPAKTAGTAAPVPPVEARGAASGRREPIFDEPPGRKPADAVRPAASDSPAPRPKQRIEMPAMQTRIEARRVETLRADPHMAGRRAKRPRVESEAWEILPPIAMPARRARRSTSWAIGLGALLLIIGITAPAAILQQGRQSAPVDQDQAAIDPISSPGQANQPPARSDEPVPGEPMPEDPAAVEAPSPAPQPQQAALPSPPPTTPDPTTPDPEPPTVEAQVQANESDGGPADAGEADGGEQAALGPVRDSGELNEAPISAPPSPEAGQVPLVNLASQDKSRPPFRQASPMVARPFTPQQPTARPFLQAPAAPAATPPNTVGTATVPIDGAGTATPPGASIGLKPALIPVLKPKAPAVRADDSASRAPVRKPKPFVPQSVEQMFQTLVNTLSEGKPPNPDLKPAPPSTRK